MLLLWSSRSPYVRKVMIVLHELGISGDVELRRVVVDSQTANPMVMKHNPLSKIPTLVVDKDVVLYDSRVICEYLDHVHGAGQLFGSGNARWSALCQQTLADGIMDADIRWLDERSRPDALQIRARMDACRVKVLGALDALNSDLGFLSAVTPTIGHAASASALAHLDFRFSDLGWRDTRPALADWFAMFSQRKSLTETAFVDTY
jgi:glutathione S-transferase